MAGKRRPGLRKRGGYWHIEKAIDGHRIYESTGETDYRRAEAYYDSICEPQQMTVLRIVVRRNSGSPSSPGHRMPGCDRDAVVPFYRMPRPRLTEA
jgi:hypothetical protein